MTSAERERELLGQFIPLHYHYQMLSDQARMTAFKQAILKMVPPGGSVVELGGGTGVMSFFAAQRAAKVWCVEHNPQMLEALRKLLALNSVADKVEVVDADAASFIPSERVDVVICEMLHSAMLREKQIEIVDSFRRNYIKKFGEALPRFIPEATILAVQLVQQNFNFQGYQAPLPIFIEPTRDQADTKQLSEPFVYNMFQYHKALPFNFCASQDLTATAEGECNALRLITKNVLAILVDENSSVDWHNLYLVLPIEQPIAVKPGDALHVSFGYPAGAPLEALMSSVKVTRA